MYHWGKLESMWPSPPQHKSAASMISTGYFVTSRGAGQKIKSIKQIKEFTVYLYYQAFALFFTRQITGKQQSIMLLGLCGGKE